MYVVTGASGRLGRQVVEHLLTRVPAKQVGVSVRDPASADDLGARGVRVRAGDFLEPGGLAHAFEDADRVLVVSAAIRGSRAAEANRAAVEAARDAGARRVLYTSHQAASADSLFAPQPVHAATQDHLAGLGVAFTALRNGFYASTLEAYVAPALETGRLVAPADGPVSWTAHRDLAEVAALALAGATATGGDADVAVLDGVTAPLTAGEALDLADVAALLGEVTGREVERVVVPDEEWVASQVARGVPALAAEFGLGLFRASRRGEFAVVDPTLARLLGRPTTTVRSFLETLAQRG